MIGVFNHAHILSIGDGLSRIKLNEAPLPEGFEITPEMATFIHGSILRNAGHWGADDVSIAFVDDEGYYILGRGDVPDTLPYNSYTARILGVCIHGKDGRIRDSGSGVWERKGYVHISKAELMKIISKDMELTRVHDLLGMPFPGGGVYDGAQSEDGESLEAYHYWCKDGEVVIFGDRSKVVEIIEPTILRI